MYCVLILFVATVFIFIANVNISVIMQRSVYKFCIIDFSRAANTFISLLMTMYLEGARWTYKERCWVG